MESTERLERIQACEEALKSIKSCLLRGQKPVMYCWDHHRKLRRISLNEVIELKREVEVELEGLKAVSLL